MAAFSREGFARKYASWVDSRRWPILIASLLVLAGSAILAKKLPVRTAVSSLLPRETRSVRDLEALKERVTLSGSAYIVVAADNPKDREQAAELVYRACTKLDESMVAEVSMDDGALPRYAWKHRFLFADLKDLREAHDALKAKIRKAKLKANPAYIDLEDEDESEKQDQKLESRIDKLRKKLDEAEAEARTPKRYVSPDGHVQVIVMRTAHMSGTAASQQLVAQLRGIVVKARAEVAPGVKLGLTGTVVQTQMEHDSILRTMTLAALITLIIVALALLAFYRSVLPVAASLFSMVVGAVLTFAITYLVIGYLNLMTAFLSAIVVGNGINTGLMLLARYFEEARAGGDDDTLARAIAGAAPGTLAAALTASAAYLSLIVTEFRGFRHFGIIAGVGMVTCWVTAFTVLPAALCVLRRRGWIRVGREPRIGIWLRRLVPRRLPALIVGAALVLAASVGITAWYISVDPFLVNWNRLRTDSDELQRARSWDALSRPAFSSARAKAVASSFAIALPDGKEVTDLAKRLRKINDVPDNKKLFGGVRVIEDLLPGHQAEKLKLLASIRKMLSDDVVDEFDEKDRETLERLTPPANLRKLTRADIPHQLAWPFTESDGTQGRLIIVSEAPRFETWNVRHRENFARKVRGLGLPSDALVGGQSFVIADILTSMRSDGPIAVLVAVLGSAIAILLIVGFGRHAGVTLLCVAFGMLVMVSFCALAGVRIHFMDLIAVPITIGIGADYAANLVARDRQDPNAGPRRVLETTGGAVLLCSFTTMVGYGSLLLSSNGGIREFGLAAILGEVACVGVALTVAPALLAYLRGERRAS
jgi:predicted RND superfamily exporter protein